MQAHNWKQTTVAMVLGLTLAAPAQARDLDLGLVIAEQGDQALRIIRAEARDVFAQSLKQMLAQPAPFRTATAPRTAPSGQPAAVRAAE